jgi:hypothetical protein
MKGVSMKLYSGALLLMLTMIAAACLPAPADTQTQPLTQLPAVTNQPQGETGETWDQWCDRVKNPTPWFSWGGDLQLREVYANNYKTLNKSSATHEDIYERTRARIWTTIKPLTDMPDVEINARFYWQWYYFDEYPEVPNVSHQPTSEHLSEGSFDNLNLTMKNFLNTPSKLIIGRQDIFLGDGWLVADGTPIDGSVTGFFDAVRYIYDINDIATTADLIYIENHAQQDAFINPIDNTGVPYAEQDERGAIVYLTNKSFENTEISPYFMYKHAEKYLASGYNGDIYVPGIRFAQKIDKNWRYRVEGAYEFGSKDGFNSDGTYNNDREDLSAFGFNSQLNYFTNDELNNNYRLSYEFLSGDKPGDKTNQGFDILWGRWARWSDLYADNVRIEANGGRPADFTNLHRIGPGWSFNPNKQIEIATDYYLLFADQNPLRDDPKFSNAGAFRGQLLTSVLKYNISKNIKGHLQGEVYLPGNYYAEGTRDWACFLRYEIVFTF